MDKEERKVNKSESERKYIQVLSHQLKAPINAIRSLLKTISDGFTEETNIKTLHYIERAENRASEAEEMISDLLDYEVYSQKKLEFAEEFDIVVLFNSLVTRYTPTASEKGIFLHPDIPLKIRIFISGDSKSVSHAIRNIIENAIHYTPSNGDITAKLDFSEMDKTCRIRIADNGYGIAEDELEQIFDPFYRSIKHKTRIPGTGLGLSIANKVVTDHKGTIEVESKTNKGSTFSIILPYSRTKRSMDKPVGRRKVIIVGGATAGPKAAARLRRLNEELDITIIEKSEFLSYSGCGLPYYISGKVRSLKALMATADDTIRDVHFFESIKNILALNNTIVLAIDRKNRRLKIKNLVSNDASYMDYDVLVLATGAVPSLPKIPGIHQAGIYTLHSIEDADLIRKELSSNSAKDVLIIGGGLIGICTAESLIEAGARVTILEKEHYILLNYLDEDIAKKVQNKINRKGIKIITNIGITKIEQTRNHFIIETDDKESYSADMIIISAGVKPNNTLAESAGLEIGEYGGIKVNQHLQTSDKNIFAIGDCTETMNFLTKKHEYWPLGSIATKMGRIAADNICGKRKDFTGSIGTAMFKIFDMNVARTGLTLKVARENSFDIETVIISGLDKVNYCKNAQHMSLKIIADKKTKAILGAQGYGKGEIASKIGILSCAIMHSLTPDDVFKLDLGYSPAFNSPIDITQTACLVLNNKMDSLFQTITMEEFYGEKDEINIIDVSPLSEYTIHSIPGSINIPLENIRMEEIPFDKNSKAVLYSKTSSGAYEAYKYLVSKGFSNLYVLEGGYLSWSE